MEQSIVILIMQFSNDDPEQVKKAIQLGIDYQFTVCVHPGDIPGA